MLARNLRLSSLSSCSYFLKVFKPPCSYKILHINIMYTMSSSFQFFKATTKIYQRKATVTDVGLLNICGYKLLAQVIHDINAGLPIV